jgi:hypothetical protein
VSASFFSYQISKRFAENKLQTDEVVVVSAPATVMSDKKRQMDFDGARRPTQAVLLEVSTLTLYYCDVTGPFDLI